MCVRACTRARALLSQLSSWAFRGAIARWWRLKGQLLPPLVAPAAPAAAAAAAAAAGAAPAPTTAPAPPTTAGWRRKKRRMVQVRTETQGWQSKMVENVTGNSNKSCAPAFLLAVWSCLVHLQDEINDAVCTAEADTIDWGFSPYPHWCTTEPAQLCSRGCPVIHPSLPRTPWFCTISDMGFFWGGIRQLFGGSRGVHGLNANV